MDLSSDAIFTSNGSEVYRYGNKNGYTNNSSSFRPFDFYECGRYEGTYEARDAGTHLSVKKCLKVWLIAALLLTLPFDELQL